jgi:hypothetical protein
MSEIRDNEGGSDHDPQLTAHYRAAASEQPSAALDSAVLAAAHRAVGARPQPAGVISRWRLPLASAALIVLSASLVLTIYREPSTEIAPAVIAHSAPSIAAKEIDKDNFAERQARSGPVATGGDATATVASSKAIAASPFPAAAEQAANNSPPPPAVSVANGKVELDARAAAGVVAPAPLAPSRLADTSSDERTARAKSTVSSLAQPATELLPEPWLEQIQALRRQGQIDRAKARFAEFRKRYPDYSLPPALQDWGRQSEPNPTR